MNASKIINELKEILGSNIRVYDSYDVRDVGELIKTAAVYVDPIKLEQTDTCVTDSGKYFKMDYYIQLIFIMPEVSDGTSINDFFYENIFSKLLKSDKFVKGLKMAQKEENVTTSGVQVKMTIIAKYLEQV